MNNDNKLAEVEQALQSGIICAESEDCEHETWEDCLRAHLLPVISRLLDMAQAEMCISMECGHPKASWVINPNDIRRDDFVGPLGHCQSCCQQAVLLDAAQTEAHAQWLTPMDCGHAKCFQCFDMHANPLCTTCQVDELRVQMHEAHADALRAAAALHCPDCRSIVPLEHRPDQGRWSGWWHIDGTYQQPCSSSAILALTPERARLERELEVARAVEIETERCRAALHQASLERSPENAFNFFEEYLAAAPQPTSVTDLEAKLGALQSKNKT